MKQIISVFICFLFILFAGCSKQEQASASSIDSIVSAEIEQIENIESYDKETIKALAVVVRTKIKNGTLKNDNYSESKNENIYNIVKETSNETLEENNELNKINYVIDNDMEWSEEIKKSDILKFLAQKNIKLSNISDISPVYSKDGHFEYLLIGGKKITYEELAKNFNLKSNNITNIKSSTSTITIYGQGSASEIFNVSQANKLAKEGKDYKEILREFYEF